MINIRRASANDLSMVAPLFDAYRVFYKKDSDLAAANSFLKERLENSESFIFLALDDNGAAAGFIQLYPLFSSTRMARLWLLNDLFENSLASYTLRLSHLAYRLHVFVPLKSCTCALVSRDFWFLYKAILFADDH